MLPDLTHDLLEWERDAPEHARASGPAVAAGRSSLSYAKLLEHFGLTPRLRGPWAIVGETGLVQGWKLHLSSTSLGAVEMLSRVVLLLREQGVSFKLACDEMILCQLNEGALGATQVGKFITIYPRSDLEARQLADRLIELTRGLYGPLIVTDLRLGDIVYTRYGNFNPVITRDRLGQTFLSIYSPDGALRIDSYQVPFVPPDGVPNPFDDHASPADAAAKIADRPAGQQPAASTELFGPGYLLLEVVKTHPKGSVFRGVDLRSQEHVSIKIVKQGRQWCLADEHGRDIRTRLQRQAALHTSLSDSVPIPKVDPYFEVNGNGYLPIDYIEGQSIESLAQHVLANRSWNSLSAAARVKLLSYLEQLLSAVQSLHAAGYVHRDLTASNIWIGTDEQVSLLDLELAHRVGDPTPPFTLGTLGFMSPDQEARKPPVFADDVYALGCVMILLLTGLDPRRVLFADQQQRIPQLHALTGGAPPELIRIVAQCVDPEPTARPDLATLKTTVQQSIATLSKQTSHAAATTPHTISGARTAATLTHQQVSRLISAGQRGLLEDVILDEQSGLWLSSSFEQGMLQAAGSYDLRRSANRGIAGVIYLLGRLARFGYGTAAARDRAQRAIQWLLSEPGTADDHLPGLHFGAAGVAVAIAEAIAGGLIERSSHVEAYVVQALSGALDWPDITHGAAGQGIAALYCADRLQAPRLLDLAQRCADYLIACQQADGSWAMPPGVDGMSGQTLTGFAHGVSGIVYFLTEFARRLGSSAAQTVAQAGTDWLLKHALPIDDGQALAWPYSTTQPDHWSWWCHGAPGIALTFLRSYEHTRDRTFADIAAKALRAHPVDVRYPNLSQCHGLSGLGEIYLEAGRVLGDHHWFDRAAAIATTLQHLRRETHGGSATWLVEDAHVPTADLMVGAGGIIHFLLRLSLRGAYIGFPLLLDPIEDVRQA